MDLPFKKEWQGVLRYQVPCQIYEEAPRNFFSGGYKLFQVVPLFTLFEARFYAIFWKRKVSDQLQLVSEGLELLSSQIVLLNLGNSVANKTYDTSSTYFDTCSTAFGTGLIDVYTKYHPQVPWYHNPVTSPPLLELLGWVCYSVFDIDSDFHSPQYRLKFLSILH